MTNEEASFILANIDRRVCDDELNDALDVAIKALKRTSWVPCSERLPKDGDTYLVTIEYKGEVIGVDVASYSPVDGYIDKHWETFNDWKEDDDSCYHVTAWMPLQEPYKAEE